MPVRNDAWAAGTPCWVDCQVEDIGKAREFYSQLFGWEILDSPAEAGGYLMAMLNGRPAAGIGPKPQGQSLPSVWTTYIASDDVDVTTEKAHAHGGQVFMPPFDVMDVGRMTVLADPTGAVFGVWQAKAHTGAGIYNEAGAYCWNELHTRDLAAAQKFYTAVFGYGYIPFQDGYDVFARPGATGVSDAIGGMADDNTLGVPADVPPHWLAWFQVSDVDAAVVKVSDLGGKVLAAPMDSPVGRMAVVSGGEGETFGVITPTAPGANS